MKGAAQSPTREDYILYRNECYNDSTAEYYYTICADGECWDRPCEPNGAYKTIGFTPYSYPCPVHWKHKTPTFEGFIIWIEKKYK